MMAPPYLSRLTIPTRWKYPKAKLTTRATPACGTRRSAMRTTLMRTEQLLDGAV